MIPIRLKLLVIVILLVLLGWKYHPRFYVTQISFVGTNFLSTSSLMAFSQQYVGQNIFWVRFFSRLPSKLRHQYPQIQSVDLSIVSRHCLRVRIHEKRPWIGMPVRGKTLFVTEDGTVLNLISNIGEVEGFMTLLFVHGVPANLVENGFIYRPFIQSLTPVVYAIQHQFPHRALQIVFNQLEFDHRILSFRDVDVIRDDVMTIRLGSFNDFDYKFGLLKRYLSIVTPEEYQTISVIDLRMIPKLWVTYHD